MEKPKSTDENILEGIPRNQRVPVDHFGPIDTRDANIPPVPSTIVIIQKERGSYLKVISEIFLTLRAIIALWG